VLRQGVSQKGALKIQFTEDIQEMSRGNNTGVYWVLFLKVDMGQVFNMLFLKGILQGTHGDYYHFIRQGHGGRENLTCLRSDGED